MIKLKGKGISAGVAIGPIFVFNPLQEERSETSSVGSIETELKRFEDALIKTKKETESTCNRLLEKEIEEAEILEAHLLILDDEEFTSPITSLISEKKLSAEQAIQDTAQKFAETLRKIKSEYISTRAKDIEDLGTQLIKNLKAQSDSTLKLTKPSIVFAHDLKASDTAKMDKKMVLGLVTEEGSPTSHASILARALKIPAIINCPSLLSQAKGDTLASINGATGEVIINPDEEMMMF